MLGSGEVIGKLQMSWDELLDRGYELFDLSFPPVCDVCPSFTLKAVVVRACDDEDSVLSDFLMDSEITRDINAGHAQLAEYIKSRTVSHLNDAMQHFKLVLGQCPVGHPDLTRYVIQHNPADLSFAVENFRLASGHPIQGFPHRIRAALLWVDKAESHQHDSALKAYQVCLEFF
jgi:hypothetical protein